MPPLPDVRIEALTTGNQLVQAAGLYRTVFGYTDPIDGLSPKLLRGLSDNGGIVVGALAADGSVIAFGYGFRGHDAGGSYHYSQAAVVSAAAQGHGLGRRLKFEQAKIAQSQGLASMRWAFDPLQARNAHFNLNVLGAWGKTLRRDYYQDGGSDRVIVQWDFEEALRRGVTPAAGQRHANTGSVPPLASVFVPQAALRGQSTSAAGEITARPLAEAAVVSLKNCFDQGLSLRHCEITTEGASYHFGPSPQETEFSQPLLPSQQQLPPTRIEQ